MIPRNFEDIAKSDIEALIANGVAERRTLEFKRQLPSNSEKDRKEFLADITSFANAQGGDILFGIVVAIPLGAPVEIAPVYVLLAGQEGSYISGEVYGVTGGAGIA